MANYICKQFLDTIYSYKQNLIAKIDENNENHWVFKPSQIHPRHISTLLDKLCKIEKLDVFDDEDCLQTIYNLIEKHNHPDCIRLSYNWCGDVKRPVILEQDTPESLLRVCDVACWTKCVKAELFQSFPENTLMEDVVQHIKQCDVLKTVVPCRKPIVNWNRNNPTSCSTNANIQNCKWLSSMYRYCADLMDLQCVTDYCEDERKIRANRAQQDIKGNITRQS